MCGLIVDKHAELLFLPKQYLMKRLLSTKYSASAFNFSMFLLRVVFGILLIAKHGYMKIKNFDDLQTHFYNFLGMGHKLNLVVAIFAETICALFIVMGLFTRFAVIPLIVAMLVAIFGANAGKPFLDSEPAILYLGVFVTILFCGPGRISIDGMINK
jgi:putative oxidoreductase